MSHQSASSAVGNASASKTTTSLDDSDSNDDIEHHRYPVERKSDLILTLYDDEVRHDFHVHQQIMATTCQYFASLIDNQDNESQMTVELPDEFEWDVDDFKQWVDICYGKYDKMLHSLAHGTNMKAFSELLYRMGAVTSITGQRDADGVDSRWTVTGHQDDGQAIAQNTVDQRTMTIIPSSCVVGPEKSVFVELAGNVDLLDMWSISHYFQHEQVSNLLISILLKYVSFADCSLLITIALAADKYQAGQLRTACINEFLATKVESRGL